MRKKLILGIVLMALMCAMITACSSKSKNDTENTLQGGNKTESNQIDTGINAETKRDDVVEPPASDFVYKYNDELDGVVIECYVGAAKEIRIPLEIEGKPVKEFALDNKIIEYVEVPEGITSIGEGAFWKCSNLTRIALPEGITSIGEGAFMQCSNLTSVILPEGITSIGEGAFLECSNLTRITLPKGITSIGESAFIGCSNLASITLPESLTSIGKYAFAGCSNLTSITLPESLTSIGESAFTGCSNLASITLPESLTSIGEYAFSECLELYNVKLPDNLEYIGDGAFYSDINVIYKGNRYKYTDFKEVFNK